VNAVFEIACSLVGCLLSLDPSFDLLVTDVKPLSESVYPVGDDCVVRPVDPMFKLGCIPPNDRQVRRDSRAGVSRRHRPVVSDCLGERIIVFVAHCDNRRRRTRSDGPHNGFLVETPEVSVGSPTASHDQDVHARRLIKPLNAIHERGDGSLPLHGRVTDGEWESRVSTAYRLTHVFAC